MTNEELIKLDENLGSQLKNIEEEIKVLDERINAKGVFKKILNRSLRARSVQRLNSQKEKLERYKQAISDLKNAISVSDPTKRSNVTAEYERVLSLEKEINFEEADTPLRVSTDKARNSLFNTLQTLYNRRLSASGGRIVVNSAIVTGVAFLLPLVGNVLGFSAIVGALSPVIWLTVGLTVARGFTHFIHSMIRKRNAIKLGKNYEDLYPTLNNIKGFGNVLGYFRGLRRSVGKRFDAMTDDKLFQKLSTTSFAPTPTTPTDEPTKGEDHEDRVSLEASITTLVSKVLVLNIDNKDEVENFINLEFNTIYDGVKAAADVEIKNKDLLELCHEYLLIVKGAHDGAINESAIDRFLKMEGTSSEFNDLHDKLVAKLKELFENKFGSLLTPSIKDLFDNYKKSSPTKGGTDTEGDYTDEEDLGEEGHDGGSDGTPAPTPDPTPEPDPTKDSEKVKEEINDLLDKMMKSTSYDDFNELLKKLNELIEKGSSLGVETSLDDETKKKLSMLGMYMNLSKEIRLGAYDNDEFYGKLRFFLNPEIEKGYSEDVKNFRIALIRQLNRLVNEDLKITDSRLTGLIDYGFEKRSSGSYGNSETQRQLINSIQNFDLRNFSEGNLNQGLRILGRARELERLKTPVQEFYLDSFDSEKLSNIEMFCSVYDDKENLASRIKACQAIINNPSGYGDEAQKSTIEDCIKTYYHLVGFVNHILSNEYSDYSYTDRNGNTQTRNFNEAGNSVSAAIDLKLVKSSQITALRKIMEFYKNNDLKLHTDISRQGQYMDEQLSGYKARR